MDRQQALLPAVTFAGMAEGHLGELVNELDSLGANQQLSENDRASIAGMMGLVRTMRRGVIGVGDTLKQIATR